MVGAYEKARQRAQELGEDAGSERLAAGAQARREWTGLSHAQEGMPAARDNELAMREEDRRLSTAV